MEVLVYGGIFLVVTTIGLLLFFYYSKQKMVKLGRNKTAMELENQQKMLQNSITIQERERKRISQDLHDAISSKLNIISLTTNVLLNDKSIKPEQEMALQQILDITANILESSRKIAHDLMPPILEEFGLMVALGELFDDVSVHSAIEIEHNMDELRLSQSNQLHVFRIIQELISNSIRHGKADELVIFIENNPKGFMMRYQDNGVGFNVMEVSKKSGIGLQNIKSRVAILNGSLKIESTKNAGSLFLIQVIVEQATKKAK